MPRRRPAYSEAQARTAVAGSKSYAEALRSMGMCASGGGTATLKKWVRRWGISTSHFDPYANARGPRIGRRRPLEEVIVENSSFNRGHLKQRLYEEGLKKPRCELCGQGEFWLGVRISLILDHMNGRGRDHRLENLRIVCPNCAATLDTHCGRNIRMIDDRVCAECGREFRPRHLDQRYCSLYCGIHHERPHLRVPRPETRKVPRPTYEQLKDDLAHMSWVAVGRKYGVSDNAVRKWMRWYERDAEAA
jgi:5-methylcytosine-specific restriction endonuclease McrA